MKKSRLLRRIAMVSFDPFIGAALIGGAASLIGGAMNRKSNKEATANQNKINEQNFQLQKEQLAWDRQAQQKTWDREDNAIQRRIADLNAAGLSPVLAAGSAAETSTPIRSQAPQLQHEEYRPDYAADLTRAIAVGQSIAQTKLIQAQTDKLEADKQLDRDRFEQQVTEFQQGHKLEEQKLEESKRQADQNLGLGRDNLSQRQLEHREEMAQTAARLGFDKNRFEKNLDITLKELDMAHTRQGMDWNEYYLDVRKQNFAENRENSINAVRETTKALNEIKTKAKTTESKFIIPEKVVGLAGDVLDILRTSKFSKWIWQ